MAARARPRICCSIATQASRGLTRKIKELGIGDDD
jgi:hypothetical protein